MTLEQALEHKWVRKYMSRWYLISSFRYIFITKEMRQTKAEGDKKKPRPRERITRGYSDLPKEDPKSSESDS